MIDSLATIQNLGSNPRSTPEASDDSKSSATLQMEDFLQLLTSQISNQDPLEPMKDTEFISQMANIASLEQMQQFSKGFESFANSHKDMVAQAYLGRVVEIKSGGEQLSGTVHSVERTDDGKISVLVNDKAYDPNDIVKVSLPPQ
ncbi:MAG: flagellar hook capping FlgD N-terminal domain-containing protein [Verrucomicrobiota bacterium]|nr:flagellar hook capping FlgD N-terminal domain-containing protein [Verrucomicrobiota bacterium]